MENHITREAVDLLFLDLAKKKNREILMSRDFVCYVVDKGKIEITFIVDDEGNDNV